MNVKKQCGVFITQAVSRDPRDTVWSVY